MSAIRICLGAALLAATLVPGPAAAAEPAPTECPQAFFADAGEVDCFRIEVPERHEAPDLGRPVILFVSILRAESDTPADDPVVFLAGGPGATAAEIAAALAGSSFRFKRDLILFEQRGTALTEPYLGCPALDIQEIFFAAEPGTDQRFAEAVGGAAAECAAAYEADGIDLAAFTTTASVEDLEIARQALGIEFWNLYAASYGTRLALEVLRHHSESVRSVVLEAVDPPDSSRIAARTPNLASAFAAADDTCAADSACATRFGDLQLLLERALDRWRVDPTTVHARFSADSFTPVLVDAGAVSSLVYSMLATDPGALPLALEQLANGDTTILELNDLGPGLIAEGMRLSIECPGTVAHIDESELHANDAAHPDLAVAFRRFPEPVACASWPSDPADAIPEAVSSDVPVLLISGALDPLTPPSSAEHAARTLAGSRHHVIEGGGHGAGIHDPCAIEIRDAFLDDPAADLPPCESPASFVTDAVAVPALADAWRAVVAPALPSSSLVPAILTVGTGLVVALVLALVALVRRPPSPAAVALALTTATMLGLGAVIGWSWLSSPPIVSMVGVPSALFWVSWATAVAAGLGVVTLAVVVRAALRGGLTRRHRLLLLASTIPLAAGVWLLAANRLALPPV